MLRRSSVLLALVLLSLSSALAQKSPVVTIVPAQPKAGELLTLTYDASVPGAKLTSAETMTGDVLFVNAERSPRLVEVPLKAEGKRWKGSVAVDSTAILVQVRFAAGGRVDDNDGNVWTLRIYDASGTPVRGANMAWGMTLMYGSAPGFKVPKDPEAALSTCEAEFQRYPEDWKIASSFWNLLMRVKPGEDSRARIGKDLVRLWQSSGTNEAAAAALVPWFERVGRKAEGDSIKRVLIAAQPQGKVAELDRLYAVMAQRDPNKRVDLMAAFMKDFPSKDEAAGAMKVQYVNALLTAKRYGEALRLVAELKTPDPNLGMTLNNAAWNLAEEGTNLDTAVILAERGVATARACLNSGKPDYLSREDWKTSQTGNLWMVLDTYAYALFRAGRGKEAQIAFAEAVQLSNGSQTDINERYVECLKANGDFKTAIDVCSQAVRGNTASEKMLTMYREAYTSLHGSDKGFDDLVSKEKAGGRKAAEQKMLDGMMSKPAVPFSLMDLTGKKVTLESLKGKVVVVDFWATWCGPCKSSFPFLQQVYEKYRSNPAVMILALNTWENKTGKEREELVRKFMADNKYTFPVLFDEGFVEKYGVEGIPTKFVLDKKGVIRFQSIGFDNGPKMVSELTSQIDFLLDDAFYKPAK